MSNDSTGEYPIQQPKPEQPAKKRWVDYVPEVVRPVVVKALENVLAAGIIFVIGWLATQGIRVEIKKNTEAVVEQNELKKLELEAWGIKRVRQDN